MLLQRRWMGAEAGAVEAGKPQEKATTGEGKKQKKLAEAASVEVEKGKKRKESSKGAEVVAGAAGDGADAAAGKRRKKDAGTSDAGNAAPVAKTAAAPAEGKAKAGLPPTATGKGANRRQRRNKKARQKQHEATHKAKETSVAGIYLEAWDAHDRGAEPPDGALPWKFNKAMQIWLLKHVYDRDVLPKPLFSIFLRYLVGLQGGARDRLRDEAKAVELLRGAPTAAPAPAPEPEGKKGKKNKNQKNKKAAAETEAPEPEDEAAAQARLEEEEKERKFRFKRARQVLRVVGGLEEDAEEAGAG